MRDFSRWSGVLWVLKIESFRYWLEYLERDENRQHGGVEFKLGESGSYEMIEVAVSFGGESVQ